MDLNDVVLVLNDKKYLVIEDVTYNHRVYLYLVNDKDESDVTFVELEDNKLYTIDDDFFLDKILPLFEKKFVSQGGFE